VIAKFIEGMKVKVDNVKYTITPVLTCNLKALMKMMGLKSVFHPCSTWWCPYCAASNGYMNEQ
jgi:hypothetical protein